MRRKLGGAGAGADQASVERRSRLLLLAYPPADRERGEEIIGTLLETAPAGGKPKLADELDVVAEGFRRRLGTAGIAGRRLNE